MSKYQINPIQRDQIDNNFLHHAPIGDQAERYISIRNFGKSLAVHLCENCPPSRELALAITHLETSIMFANAAIARTEGPHDADPKTQDISGGARHR